MKKPKVVKAWGGFSEGELHIDSVIVTYCAIGEKCRAFAVFTSRRQALQRYEDVRRIEIRVIDKEPAK